VRYAFDAWPLDTKLRAIGGVFLVTQRTYEDRTFRTKATHRSLGIGETANFAEPLMTSSERDKLLALGANCICVFAAAEEARRREIASDLIEGNSQWGGVLHDLRSASGV
jgi:hypothetical protein